MAQQALQKVAHTTMQDMSGGMPMLGMVEGISLLWGRGTEAAKAELRKMREMSSRMQASGTLQPL